MNFYRFIWSFLDEIPIFRLMVIYHVGLFIVWIYF